MTWGEAIRLTRVLSMDPASAVCAALNGWPHTASREALILMDLFDLQHRSKAKRKPQPYPRPWGDKARKRMGRTTLSPEQARNALAERGVRPTP